MKNWILIVLVVLLNASCLGFADDKVEAKNITIDESMDEEEVEKILSSVYGYMNYLNTGKKKWLKASIHKDYKALNNAEGTLNGVEGIEETHKTIREAVSNLGIIVEEIIISQDKVVVRYQMVSNFNGQIGTIVGLDQPIDFDVIDVYTMKEGKIWSSWHQGDYYSLLLKMNAIYGSH